MCRLYGGCNEDSLNKLRYQIPCKKGSTSKSAITPESLPPTSDATTYHSYRAYHQVQVWMGFENIDPLQWGWKLQREMMMPIPMQKAPAPDCSRYFVAVAKLVVKLIPSVRV